MSNLYQRIQGAWRRIKVSPSTPFVGWIWGRDIDRDVQSLRSQLRGQDDMERLDNYMRLKEPWRYPEE